MNEMNFLLLLLAMMALCASFVRLSGASEVPYEGQEHNHGAPHRLLFSMLNATKQNATETVPAASDRDRFANISVTPVGHVFCTAYCERSYASNFYISGRLITVSNPVNHVTVLPPHGGCGKAVRASRTASMFGATRGVLPGCRVAVNAGFFTRNVEKVVNVTTNETKTLLCNSGESECQCLGHLVSQGKTIQSTLRRNAHFGLQGNAFVTGYVTEEELESFDELVGGVVWLVRNGSSYVKESTRLEFAGTQETSQELEEEYNKNSFVSTFAARTVIGHDAAGKLLILQVDGLHGRNSWAGLDRGIDLHSLADLLIRLGFQNAINLDGGGSSTLVINDTLSNYPSDKCDDGENFVCERPVSSIICIHDDRPLPSQGGSTAGGGCTVPPSGKSSAEVGMAVAIIMLTILLLLSLTSVSCNGGQLE
eukprot:g2517.t1